MNSPRSDDQWLQDLSAADIEQRNNAVADLRDMLSRGLAMSLSKQGHIDDAFLEDVVQDASLKILQNLQTFQGRSKFRTWAITIAVRSAVSQMRRREWRNVSLSSLTMDAELNPQIAVDKSETDERAAGREELLRKLTELIDSELTKKQWTAITAELRGMPLAEVAEKMESNPNSLYKLLHDARKKLRRGLESAGFTMDDVRAILA